MALVDSICNSCDVLADFPQLFYIPDLPQLFCIPGKEGIEFFAIERRKTEKELIWADPISEEAQKVSILDPIGIVVIESGLLVKDQGVDNSLARSRCAAIIERSSMPPERQNIPNIRVALITSSA